MSDQYIMEVLQSRMRTFVIAKTLMAAFEGNNFTPDANRTYLADFLLPAPTANPSMGRNHRRYEGIYQVDVNVPTSKGPGELRTLANELAAYFPRGLTLEHSSGLKVLITRDASISALIPDAGRMKRAVSIRYQTDIIT